MPQTTYWKFNYYIKYMPFLFIYIMRRKQLRVRRCTDVHRRTQVSVGTTVQAHPQQIKTCDWWTGDAVDTRWSRWRVVIVWIQVSLACFPMLSTLRLACLYSKKKCFLIYLFNINIISRLFITFKPWLPVMPCRLLAVLVVPDLLSMRQRGQGWRERAQMTRLASFGPY